MTRYEFGGRKRNLEQARAETAPGFLHGAFLTAHSLFVVSFRTHRRVRKIAVGDVGTGWRGLRGDLAHAVGSSANPYIQATGRTARFTAM